MTATPASRKPISISVRGQGTIHAYSWVINYPFDHPVHDLEILKLRNPADTVVTLQAHQPDSGSGHHDQWLVKVIGVSEASIRIMTVRMHGADYGSVRIDGTVVERG